MKIIWRGGMNKADAPQRARMSRHDLFWEGVGMYQSGDKCPENAPEALQKGYGIAYAAAEAKPPIDLDKFEEQFREVFK